MDMHINWTYLGLYLLATCLKSILVGTIVWIIYCARHEIWEWIAWNIWLKWRDLVAFIVCLIVIDFIFTAIRIWL